MKEGWEYKKLGEVASIKSGKSIDASNIRAQEESLYPCYGGNGIRGYVDSYSYDGIIPIIGRVGALCGNVHLAKGKIYATEHALVVDIKTNEVSPNWLTQCLVSLNLRKYAKGVAQPVLSAGEVSKITISIPPLSEQQHIVEELDLLSSIIEKKKAQLNELDNLAQSLFYEMFGENSYKKVTLADVVEITSSLVSPLELPYADMLHVSPSNIISNTGEIVDCIKAKEEKLISGKYTFTKGVILYSKIRPNLNKVAIPTFDGICSADMYPLSVKENATNVFVWRLLLSKDFLEFAIKHSGRARMPKLNRETLYSYRFSLPPLSLQQQFASKIEAIEHQKELIKQSIKEVETLFNSRMDYYFN